MFSFGPLTFHALGKTNLNNGFQHSILISALRGLAAVQVLAAHLRAQLFPGLSTLSDPSHWYQALAFFTGFAHQAVVVFFLLSGWLVGGSLLNRMREPGVMLHYAIDRLTRLWIVLIPCFVITLMVGLYIGTADVSHLSFSPADEYSIAAFVGNLFGLQDMLVPRYGGNFALWSLANETWYYVLFPLLVLPHLDKRPVARMAALGALVVIAHFLSFRIVLYSVIWLLGVVASRVRVEAGRGVRAGIVLALAALSVYFRMAGSNDILTEKSFVQDGVFSIVFLVFLSSQQFPADQTRMATRLAARLGNLLAPFSFTLYVIHVPLLVLLRHLYAPVRTAHLSPGHVADLFVYGAFFTLILVAAYALYWPFEAQTPKVRKLLKRTWATWGKPAGAA